MAVEPVAPGVVSVVLKGHYLERLPLSGGQFFQWRFLKRGVWWQAHPYSVSAVAHPPYLRFTVKDLGDHSASLAHLKPGTHVAIEGPYGAFTADQRRSDRVALIGAGVGITPLRALLEDLPAHVDTVMVARAHTVEDLVHADELRTLVDARHGQLHELVGPRQKFPFAEITLARLIPDLADRDLYICGPTGFTASMRGAAHALGVPDERIHHETFAF
jgi:ferredoxin-NADP reductase